MAIDFAALAKRVNWDGQESTGGGGIKELPLGEHIFTVTGWVSKVTNKGQEIIQLDVVTEDGHKGQHTMWLHTQGGVAKTAREVRTITGKKLDRLEDIEHVNFKDCKFKGKVEAEKYNGKVSNKIQWINQLDLDERRVDSKDEEGEKPPF